MALKVLGVLAGLVAGTVLGGSGSGGSLMALPIARHMLGLTPAQAAVTSLAAVAVAAAVGAARSVRVGQVSGRAVLVVGAPAAAGAVVGGHLAAGVSAAASDGLLAACLLAALVATCSGRSAARRSIRAHRVWGLATLAGTASGLAGVGAGVLVTPLLLSSGLSERRAGGTALVIVTVLVLAGLVPRVLAGARPDPELTTVLAVTMAGGVLVGNGIAGRAPRHRVRRVVAVLLVVSLASTVSDAIVHCGIA